VELRHLRYFVAVAEERHFGRAAARLHIAQPPLSQQIRQLEAELGFPLLERTTRRVDLTDAGRAYLEHARVILIDVERAGERARRVADGLEGELRVGCVGSATYSLMPAFARELRRALPAVDSAFRGEMLVSQQVDALLNQELDLAILRPPVHEASLKLSKLRSDRLLVAVPDDHRVVGQNQARMSDLNDETFVAHTGRDSIMHGVLMDLCADAGFAPRVRHEVVETSTLVTFVSAGLGVAVVPEGVARLGIPGVVFLPLVGERTLIDLSAAVRADDSRPVVGRALRVLETVVRSAI
jgi:DNA-binding transcriptional LysR family regulator